MKPWVVVPAHNEAPSVGAVAAAAAAWAPVLVIDDGSTDGTAAVARAAGAEVISHPRRLGKGQALRTGFAAARRRGASHAVTMDGDGQHAPADLPVLLAAVAETPRALVVGSRLAPERPTAALPADRLNAIRLAGFFVNWATDLRLSDTQSGFRAYPLALLDDVRTRRGGFVLETEVLLAAARRGWPVREVPVTPLAAGRPSRLGVADGFAIGAYLAGQAARRWAVELTRPGRAAAAGAAPVDFPGWPPRRRRVATAAVGSAAAPAVLALTLVQHLLGSQGPDLAGPLVARLYRQDRLDGTAATPAGDGAAAPAALP